MRSPAPSPSSPDLALNDALDYLHGPLVEWVTAPSPAAKLDLLRAWAELAPDQKSALAQDVRRAFLTAHGTEQTVAYRRLKPDDLDYLRGGMSLTTDRAQVANLLPERYRAYLIRPADLLLHWAQDTYLGSRTWKHEREIILLPHAQPPRVAAQGEPNPAAVTQEPLTSSDLRAMARWLVTQGRGADREFEPPGAEQAYSWLAQLDLARPLSRMQRRIDRLLRPYPWAPPAPLLRDTLLHALVLGLLGQKPAYVLHPTFSSQLTLEPHADVMLSLYPQHTRVSGHVLAHFADEATAREAQIRGDDLIRPEQLATHTARRVWLSFPVPRSTQRRQQEGLLIRAVPRGVSLPQVPSELLSQTPTRSNPARPASGVSDLARRAADLLQGWTHGLNVLGAKEVLAWDDGPRIRLAFRGDALRIELRCLVHPMLPNPDFALDLSLQRALGLEPRVERRGWRVVDISPQTMDESQAHLSEVLGTISDLLSGALEQPEDADSPFTAPALMPLEGSPWVAGSKRGTPYYNARTGQVEITPKPSWLIEVEVTEPGSSERHPDFGADFCQLLPRIEPSPAPALGLRTRTGQPAFLTHCFGLTARGTTAWDKLKSIKRCGGWLFPSLALGHLPAVMFGPLVLAFDPALALAGMKPYRQPKGRWPVVTYTTDVWTETLGSFLGQSAHVLYQQLTGYWSPGISGQPHLYILGPPVEFDGGPAAGQIVRTTAKLRAELTRRQKRWPRGLAAAQLEAQREAEGVSHYPYLEVKAHGIVTPAGLVAACAPRSDVRALQAFLRRLGVDVPVVAIPLSDHERQALESPHAHPELTYAYAWSVQDALAELAHRTPGGWQPVQE